MEPLLLLLIAAAFILPMFLTMRRQSKMQKAMQDFQASLTPGQRVVCAGGLHGTVVGVASTTVDIELAPGVVVTMEKMGVVRNVGDAMPGQPAAAANDVQETSAVEHGNIGTGVDGGDSPRPETER